MKIGDFGLSVFDGEWSGEFGSQRGGNPRWLAPELLLPGPYKRPRPTFSSDIYSFAMVCIEVRKYSMISRCISFTYKNRSSA